MLLIENIVRLSDSVPPFYYHKSEFLHRYKLRGWRSTLSQIAVPNLRSCSSRATSRVHGSSRWRHLDQRNYPFPSCPCLTTEHPIIFLDNTHRQCMAVQTQILSSWINRRRDRNMVVEATNEPWIPTLDSRKGVTSFMKTTEQSSNLLIVRSIWGERNICSSATEKFSKRTMTWRKYCQTRGTDLWVWQHRSDLTYSLTINRAHWLNFINIDCMRFINAQYISKNEGFGTSDRINEVSTWVLGEQNALQWRNQQDTNVNGELAYNTVHLPHWPDVLCASADCGWWILKLTTTGTGTNLA